MIDDDDDDDDNNVFFLSNIPHWSVQVFLKSVEIIQQNSVPEY